MRTLFLKTLAACLLALCVVAPRAFGDPPAAQAAGGKITCSWSVASGEYTAALASEHTLCAQLSGEWAKSVKTQNGFRATEAAATQKVSSAMNAPISDGQAGIERLKGILADSEKTMRSLSSQAKDEADRLGPSMGAAAQSPEKLSSEKGKINLMLTKFLPDQRAAVAKDSLAMQTYANQMEARGQPIPPAAQERLNAARDKLIELQEKEKRLRALLPYHDQAIAEQSANAKKLNTLVKSLRTMQSDYLDTANRTHAKAAQLAQIKLDSGGADGLTKDDGRPKSTVTGQTDSQKKLSDLLANPSNATERMVGEGTEIGKTKAAVANPDDETAQQITDTATADTRQGEMDRHLALESIGGSAGAAAAVKAGSKDLAGIEKQMNGLDLSDPSQAAQYDNLSKQYQAKVDNLCQNAVVCEELTTYGGVSRKFSPDAHVSSPEDQPAYDAMGNATGYTSSSSRIVSIDSATSLAAKTASPTYQADLAGRYSAGTQTLEDHVAATAKAQADYQQAQRVDAVGDFLRQQQQQAPMYQDPYSAAVDMGGQGQATAAANGALVKQNPIAAGQVLVTSTQAQTPADIYSGLGAVKKSETVESLASNVPLAGSALQVQTTGRDMDTALSQNLTYHTQGSADAYATAKTEHTVAQVSLAADVVTTVPVGKGLDLAAKGLTSETTTAARDFSVAAKTDFAADQRLASSAADTTYGPPMIAKEAMVPSPVSTARLSSSTDAHAGKMADDLYVPHVDVAPVKAPAPAPEFSGKMADDVYVAPAMTRVEVAPVKTAAPVETFAGKAADDVYGPRLLTPAAETEAATPVARAPVASEVAAPIPTPVKVATRKAAARPAPVAHASTLSGLDAAPARIATTEAEEAAPMAAARAQPAHAPMPETYVPQAEAPATVAPARAAATAPSPPSAAPAEFVARLDAPAPETKALVAEQRPVSANPPRPAPSAPVNSVASEARAADGGASRLASTKPDAPRTGARAPASTELDAHVDLEAKAPATPAAPAPAEGVAANGDSQYVLKTGGKTASAPKRSARVREEPAVPTTAGVAIEPSEAARAVELQKQSELVGKSFEEVGPPVPRSLSLEEASERRIEWVKTQHAEFTEIKAADNRRFIKMQEAAARGEKTEMQATVTVENAVLKTANDVVVLDKDLVTSMDNLHKSLLVQEIKKDPKLNSLVVGYYNDYKGVGFALKKNDEATRALLAAKIDKVNSGFDEFLKKVETAKGWKERTSGISADMRTWHQAGIGANFQEAGLAARMGRKLSAASGKADLVNFADHAAHFEEITNRVATNADSLARDLGHVPDFMNETPAGKLLSEDAIETIRKAKPAEGSAETADQAVQKAVKARFGHDLTEEQAAALRAHLADIDSMNPSLLIEERTQINMGLHDEGVVSFDFKGQNSRNLYQTQKAILEMRGASMSERMAAIKKGDMIATEQLNGMKQKVKDAIAALGEEYTGPTHSFDEMVQMSGDDGIFLPLKELGPKQKELLAQKLNENGVGEFVRHTYVPKYYRGTLTPIAEADRSAYVVEAEKIEKDLLTKTLVGKIPTEEFKGLQIKVDLRPAQSGKSGLGITLIQASGRPIPAKTEKLIRAALKDKYDTIFVDRSNLAARKPK